MPAQPESGATGSAPEPAGVSTAAPAAPETGVFASGAGVDPIDFLAGVGAVVEQGEAGTTSESGAEAPKPETSTTTTTGKSAGGAEEEAEGQGAEAKTEELTSQADEAGEDDEIPADAKVPEWVNERIGKLSGQKRELREQLTAEKAAREAAEKALAEATAAPQAPLPPSPLAHLDTADKLGAEVKRAAEFLKWTESTQDPSSIYKDDDAGTADEKLARDRAYALHVIEHQLDQQEVIRKREESVKAARQTRPEMFDAKTDDGKFLGELVRSDPRTRPDFYQLVADALRGRRDREDEASGKFKIQRIDLAAAKAAGAKGAQVKAAEAKGSKVPPKYVPPVTASPAPVRPDTGQSTQQSVWEKSRKGAVDLEEMLTAGAI